VPSAIPELKARVASVTLAECRALADEALQQTGAAAVRALLATAATTPEAHV
jgi:phosphoenolpyruvate-protein kinase (PTS system EI component)